MLDIKQEYAGQFKSILLAAGIDRKFLTGRHSECVFCGGRDRSRWIESSETLWCNQCSPKSAIDVLIMYLGLPFREVCSYIRGYKGEYKKVKEKPKKDPMILLNKVTAQLKKVEAGDVVHRYLKSRNINIIPKHNIFTAKLPYYAYDKNGKKVDGMFDCLVARISNLKGEIESYQIIYLNDDGTKLGRENTADKIITTPVNGLNGNACRIDRARDTVAVCEGIETGLKIAELEEMPVWCAMSATGMNAIQIPLTVVRVEIYGDCDASFTGQSAAYSLAKRLMREADSHKIGREIAVNVNWGMGVDYLDYMNKNHVTDKKTI